MDGHSQTKTSASHTARARSAWQTPVQTPMDPRCEDDYLWSKQTFTDSKLSTRGRHVQGCLGSMQHH